jgi:hypothetical protein
VVDDDVHRRNVSRAGVTCSGLIRELNGVPARHELENDHTVTSVTGR